MSGYGNLGRSISTGIGSFFGNNQARQAGEMAGLQQVALGDQIEQRRQAALFEQQKAQREADAAALGKPDAALSRIAALFQVPADSLPAIKEYQRTGNLPMTPAEPLAPGLQGPEAPPQMPAGLTPEKLTNIAQMFFADQSAQAGSSKTLKDAIEALVMQPKASLTQGVADGSIAPGTGGARFAALEGKPLFNSDANGAVLDVFGGGLREDSQLARGTIGLRAAQAAAQKANAAQSYAAADNSRASAAQTRAETAAGMSTGGTGGRAPVGYRWGATGNLEPIPGGPADPATKGAKLAKPPTEGQAKALVFSSRMQVADDVLNELAEQGQRNPNLVKRFAESLPFIGEGAGMVANTIGSAGEQQVEQAQRDFVNAVLRRESGAAIGVDEFRNASKQYFPQPGDSPAVIRQKAINRQTAISGMKAEFGEQGEPDFQRIVNEARTARRPSQAPAPSVPAAVARTTPRPSSPTATTDPVPVTSDADYLNLPSGTRFRAPDGTIRVKP